MDPATQLVCSADPAAGPVRVACRQGRNVPPLPVEVRAEPTTLARAGELHQLACFQRIAILRARLEGMRRFGERAASDLNACLC